MVDFRWEPGPNRKLDLSVYFDYKQVNHVIVDDYEYGVVKSPRNLRLHLANDIEHTLTRKRLEAEQEESKKSEKKSEGLNLFNLKKDEPPRGVQSPVFLERSP